MDTSICKRLKKKKGLLDVAIVLFKGIKLIVKSNI